VRRALRRRLPAFSHWFHLQPWDLQRLTFGELRGYVEALDEIERQMAEAKQGR